MNHIKIEFTNERIIPASGLSVVGAIPGKSDFVKRCNRMDVERLPSGKFETNELVLKLTMIAYNILRMIGQETTGGRGPKPRHKVHRRRLRTVIGNLIMLASHIITHARQVVMGPGRSNVWRHAFASVYSAFAGFQL